MKWKKKSAWRVTVNMCTLSSLQLKLHTHMNNCLCNNRRCIFVYHSEKSRNEITNVQHCCFHPSAMFDTSLGVAACVTDTVHADWLKKPLAVDNKPVWCFFLSLLCFIANVMTSPPHQLHDQTKLSFQRYQTLLKPPDWSFIRSALKVGNLWHNCPH